MVRQIVRKEVVVCLTEERIHAELIGAADAGAHELHRNSRDNPGGRGGFHREGEADERAASTTTNGNLVTSFPSNLQIRAVIYVCFSPSAVSFPCVLPLYVFSIPRSGFYMFQPFRGYHEKNNISAPSEKNK